MRNEVEKVLQEQRLEKIRRDFERWKFEDERRFKHDKWLEDQKWEILAAKLREQAAGGGGNEPQTAMDDNSEYPQTAKSGVQDRPDRIRGPREFVQDQN